MVKLKYRYCFSSWEFVEVIADSEEEAYELAKEKVKNLFDESELISISPEIGEDWQNEW